MFVEKLKTWFGTIRTLDGLVLASIGLGIVLGQLLGLITYVGYGLITWGGYKFLTSDKNLPL